MRWTTSRLLSAVRDNSRGSMLGALRDVGAEPFRTAIRVASTNIPTAVVMLFPVRYAFDRGDRMS
ncbi:MAG: hypothetical protein ACR2PG_07725 [Hyphomicrobiaceae bacterium]